MIKKIGRSICFLKNLFTYFQRKDQTHLTLLQKLTSNSLHYSHEGIVLFCIEDSGTEFNVE